MSHKLSNILRGVEAVFFDLFDTLVEVDPERMPKLEGQGGQLASTVPLLVDEVRPHREDIDEKEFLEAFRQVTDEVFAEKVATDTEISTHVRFERLLERLDVRPGADETKRLARRLTIVHMQTITRSVRPVDHVEDVLEAIRAAGRELALISNLDHAHAARWVLEQTDLLRFFETRIVSEEIGVRKPNERMFREALDRVGVEPAAAIHVGDDPEADVWGAGRAGIRTVWVNRKGVPYPKDEYPPTWTVARLADSLTEPDPNKKKHSG